MGRFGRDPRDPRGRNRDVPDFCLKRIKKRDVSRAPGAAPSVRFPPGPDQIREIFGPLTPGENKHSRPPPAGCLRNMYSVRAGVSALWRVEPLPCLMVQVRCAARISHYYCKGNSCMMTMRKIDISKLKATIAET